MAPDTPEFESAHEAYPVRRETGVARVSRRDLPSKLDRTGKHLKADNLDFVDRLIVLTNR